MGAWVRRVGVVLSVGFVGLGMSGQAWAVDPITYQFTPSQVTDSTAGESDQVVVSPDGATLAFISSKDGNPEVYMKAVGDPTLTQVTNTAGRTSANPRVGGGGTLLFQSDADLVPGKNINLTPETFALDVNGTMRQLTNDQPFLTPPVLPAPAPASKLSSASATDDGLLIVYSSTINCAGSLGARPEIYLYDVGQDSCIQITSNSDGANLHPTIDAFGSVIAFLTSASTMQIDGTPLPLSNADQNYEVVEVLVEQIFNDPCVTDPTDPSCDPCSIDPSDPACDPCAIDPTAPGCSNAPPAITISPSAQVTVNEGQQVVLTIDVVDPDGLDTVSLRVAQSDGSPISTLGGATFTVDMSQCDPTFEDCTCNPVTEDCFLNQVSATFRWTPGPGKGGQDYQLLFTSAEASDPSITSSEPVLITVNRVNRAPTLTSAPGLPANETLKATSTTRTYTITGSDPDCDSMTLEVLSLPTGATASTPVETPCAGPTGQSKISMVVTWTPDTPTGVQETLGVKVTDVGGLSATKEGKFTVVDNQAPKLTLAPVTVVEGSSIKIMVKATDADGDPLRYDVDPSTPLPAGAVFKNQEASPEFNWLPWFGAALGGAPTDYNMTLRASDCAGGPGTDDGVCVTATANLKITVSFYDPNKAIFTSPSAAMAVAPGGTASFNLTAKNTGSSTWTSTSGIALSSKTVTTGLPVPTPVPLTQTVVPGQTVTLQAKVTAPTKPGTYYVTWQMTDDGKAFGGFSGYTTLNVK